MVFEDYFSELQTDMVSICLEYVSNKADIIYIYGSCEGQIISCDHFYKINGQIVQCHKLNDIDLGNGFKYDVSSSRQDKVLTILIEDIEKIENLCKEYKRDMPTEFKLIYDVKDNRLNANHRYDLIYTNDPVKTADDVAEEWFEEINSQS